jgi:hypothetical protein
LKQAGDPIEIPRGVVRLGAVLCTLLTVLIAYELWWRR